MMDQSGEKQVSDPDVRHFIYTTFAETSRPPTTGDIADHYAISIAEAEQALTRLAKAHQIALAPGSHSIWMAHPFSAVPTNFTAEVGGKKYWAN